jgi:hypothetical protein
MDYYTIYHKICERGKSRIKRTHDGLERHHIVPKSCGGSDLPDNITVLTAREHYLCHKMLVKIYQNYPEYRKKMIYALWWMSKTRVGACHVTSKDYELARQLFVENLPTRQAEYADRFRQNHAAGKYDYDYSRVGQTLRQTLCGLSKEQMADRMRNSAQKCDHTERGKSIARGKGSQIQITRPDQSKITMWSYDDTEKICGLKWSQLRYRLNSCQGQLPDGSKAKYIHRYTGNDTRRIQDDNP